MPTGARAGFLIHVAGLPRALSPSTSLRRFAPRTRADATDLRERFDLAISRATAPPPVLCELALPLVRTGGALCALVAMRRCSVSAMCRRSVSVRWWGSRSAAGHGSPPSSQRSRPRQTGIRDDPGLRAVIRSAESPPDRRRSPPPVRSTGSRRRRSRASSRVPCRRKGRCRPGPRAPPRSRSPPRGPG